MLSHIERKILNICFHLNRKGQLSLKEISFRSRKEPVEVKLVLKHLYKLGFINRNSKGHVEVHLDEIQNPGKLQQQYKKIEQSWYE